MKSKNIEHQMQHWCRNASVFILQHTDVHHTAMQSLIMSVFWLLVYSVIWRYAHHIYKVHVADGFSNDCDELIYKCLQMQTLDYHTFCNFWKDLNFGMIYQGRQTGAEIAELTEEVVHIAKHYMIKDTSNVEESIAGLFLVYGLLKLQPYTGFAWLRIIPDDLQAINRIETVARRERRLDVLYILGEVLIKYSQYHVAERERGMESVLKKYFEGYTSIDKLGVRPKGVFLRQNEELDLIRDMGSISRQYVRAKKSLIGGESEPSLQYINDNLPNEMNSSLRRVINGIVDTDICDDDDDDDPDYHYSNVMAIKTKAMRNAVNPMKHLQGIVDRENTKTNLIEKSDLKSPTGKIKTGSPTKLVTNSPRKRKASIKEERKRKIGKHTPKDGVSGNTELNLEEFDKEIVTKKDNEQEVDIEIDMLPSILRSEDKQIEVEIIDNIDRSEEINQNSETGDQIERNNDSDKIIESMESEIIRRNRGIMHCTMEKIDKKKPKRTKIKSKFRRQGMLLVANFDE